MSMKIPNSQGKSYVMSDIHGCYDEYLQMLSKINFSDSDTLYILGDAIDRGEKSVEVLRDMSKRSNIVPIMGNHEYMAVVISKQLQIEYIDGNANISMNKDIREIVKLWLEDGGDKTLKSVRGISYNEVESLLKYMERFSPYQIVEVEGRRFVLTHAGVPDGANLSNLHEFNAYEFLTASMDYAKNYFGDATLVTGHTPTAMIDKASIGKMYHNNNNIAIDTGGVFIGTFACLCLDTMEEFYVETEKPFGNCPMLTIFDDSSCIL